MKALIVEEKPICRQAMGSVIADGGMFDHPAFAGSLAEAMDLMATSEFTLVLVDLFTVGYDFEGLRRLIDYSSAGVVAIDDRPNPTFATLARQAGAGGYACKSFEIEAFRAVLQTVTHGGVHFPRQVLLPQRAQRTPRTTAGLTPRQLEVLKCIAVGMSNQEIAQSLGITIGTVKLHAHAVLRLTGTRNRTEAALIAGRFVAPLIKR